MLTKELFFHQQTPFGKSLGFSAIFVPQNQGGQAAVKFNDKGDQLTWMAITFCNKNDKAFSKKIARTVLRNRALEEVRVKDIPMLLQNAAMKSMGHKWPHTHQYSNLLRHFV